jgi:hypothetical protein
MVIYAETIPDRSYSNIHERGELRVWAAIEVYSFLCTEPALLVVVVTLFVLVFVLMSLRLYTRVCLVQWFGSDDMVLIISLVR